MSFLVVYFLKIDEVEVISHAWRTSKGKCKWPPCLDRLQVKKYMLQHRAPESDWMEYRVVVMGKYDNYATAKKKVQQALEMSSADSDESDLDTRTKGRRGRKKRKYSSSDNSEDEPRNSPAPVILNVAPSVRQDLKQEEEVAVEELISSVEFEPNASLVSDGEFEASATPAQRHILSKLNEMIDLQRQNNMLLQRILGSENRSYVPDVNKPKLPIDNDEELQLWESFLNDSENFNSCVTFFGHRIGLDLKHSTRVLLGIFLTNKYATEYNWAGREPKKPFRNLKLMTFILCTLKSNGFQAVPTITIENTVKDWLKQAPTRINRSSERQRDVSGNFKGLSKQR